MTTRPALTIVASHHPDVFKAHPLDRPIEPTGELRINPLYAAVRDGNRTRFSLRFPSTDYEEEYGACRQYLPDTFELEQGALDAIARGEVPPELGDLARRRVLVDLPRRYY